MGAQLQFRVATAQDGPDLARLSGQLGYPSGEAEIVHRLPATAEGREVIVAVREGRIVAWMELTERAALEIGDWGEITGIVVEESLRGQGIGAALLAHAKSWTKVRGLPRLRVRTNQKRADAQRFFERHGFGLTKEHKVYDQMVR